MQSLPTMFFSIIGMYLLLIIAHELGHATIWILLNPELVAYGLWPHFEVTITAIYTVPPAIRPDQVIPVAAGGLLFTIPLFLLCKHWYQKTIWAVFVLYGVMETCYFASIA